MDFKLLWDFIEYLETSHAITINWKELKLKKLIKEYISTLPKTEKYDHSDPRLWHK